MSDRYSEYDRDVLSEFEKLKNRFETSAEETDDLSKTMVVPRVEDIIEERPLKTENADLLFAEPGYAKMRFGNAEDFDLEKILEEDSEQANEEPVRLSRVAMKANKTSVSKLTELKSKVKALISEKKNKAEDVKAETKETVIEESREDAKKPKMPKAKKKHKKISIKKIILIIIAVCLAMGIAVACFVAVTISKAPDINPDNIYELLSENSIIYDKDGNTIDNIYSGNALRTNLEFSEIPKQLIDSFVSIEDKTFWTHHGFNFIRIVGAVWQKVSGQSERIGGTSTITQQLARNLYLPQIKNERSLSRKVMEAYYTIQLEQKLSKEQIIEAYLNTIYLGYNCNGVAAAAEAYFSKDVQDLSLLECAQLAALPQSPNNYAPLKRVALDSVEDIEALDVISKDDDWVVYYNPAGADRIKLVLYYLHDQGKLDDATYESAKADSIRDYLNPGSSAVNTTTTSYFADYVKDQVLKDLITAGYDEETANKLLYSGGLRINSTMDMRVQEIMDKEYDNPDNFPGVAIQRKDAQGNALDSDGRVLLYNMTTYFNADGNFVLSADEYKELSNGDMLIYSGKRMNFYKTTVAGEIDYSAEFKDLYEMVDGVCYSRDGGVLQIAKEYKDRNADGDLIISHEFFDENPNAFTKNDDGTVTISKDFFTLKQQVRQPQSAMVIMDYKTGYIKGMVGGRDIEGKLLYNRATSTRQPGSSIKPLAVYSLALQMGFEGTPGFTAAMPIDDAPILRGGAAWPKNWYAGYTGITNLRHAVEQSINACAVNLYMQIGDPQRSIDQLRKMGITSVVSENEGPVNDANASALALGGMTRGISPLEMTAAYGTFGNYGTYTEPICYTTVTTKNGDIVLSKEPSHVEVLDESVASLMTDILRTVVTNGLGSGAKLSSQPSAGKTGTTTDRYDIWFCGLTPQYSAATWIGSDVNIPVNSDSSKAAKLWAKIMDQVCSTLPREEFEMKGDFVTATVDKYSGTYSPYTTSASALTEIFIAGTEPGSYEESPFVGLASADVCAQSGYLATPLCPSMTKVGVVRPGGLSWEKQLAQFEASVGHSLNLTKDSMPDAVNDLPDYYCPYHNPNPSQYPVSPYADTSIPLNPIDDGGEDYDYEDEDYEDEDYEDEWVW